MLPFSVLPSSTSPGSSKASVSLQTNGTTSSNSESKPPATCEEKPKVNGGLVTGAPSPPDVKESAVKSQASPDPVKVSKSLNLENSVEKASGQSSESSPEAKPSSQMENELMIIDQSPPAKVNNDEVRNDKIKIY